MGRPPLVGHLAASALPAQVPDAPASAAPVVTSPANPPAKNGGPATKSGKIFGNEIPLFDPGSDTLMFNGDHWNINHNRLAEARFEKYLNAPEETSAESREYQQIIDSILKLIAPGNATQANVDLAFQKLAQGSRFDIDARLCDALAGAIYSAWSSQSARDRLAEANKALERELSQAYWNQQHSSSGTAIKQTPKSSGAQAAPGPAAAEDVSVQVQHAKRIATLEALIKANAAKRELTQIEAKVQFQALMVQFFMQRRFQHVLMAARFYATLFRDGDTSINVGTDAQDFFAKGPGQSPTVGTLETVTMEAIRDVREGIAAFETLVATNDMASASKRLAEAFAVGEYMPETRTLPLAKKRQVLAFVQKSNKLIGAIDVKDYTLAEELVKELEKMAHDFDGTKPRAAVESAKTLAGLRLEKARNAVAQGNDAAVDAEITAATEIWPRNPELTLFAKTVLGHSNRQSKAVLEFDMLAGQKNYRQIFDDRARFLAALSLQGDKQKQQQLEEALNNVQTIDLAINQANVLARQTNFPGAWESLEKIAAQFPDDAKLNKARAELTTDAAEFVRIVRGAQSLERKDQVGASLAWYLKAQKLYPQSEFAGEGVNRLVQKILPSG